MAWNDPNYVKFDISAMDSMINELDATAQELQELSVKLMGEIDQLKRDWKTDAAKVFTEKFDDGWAGQVKEYIEVVNSVNELLKEAKSQYIQIEEKANSISF